MPEDKFAEINELWEEVQLAGLRCAKAVLTRAVKPDNATLHMASVASDQQIALAVAVIGTMGPNPLGVDDMIAGLAAAAENADTADAVKSGPIV